MRLIHVLLDDVNLHAIETTVAGVFLAHHPDDGTLMLITTPTHVDVVGAKSYDVTVLALIDRATRTHLEVLTPDGIKRLVFERITVAFILTKYYEYYPDVVSLRVEVLNED